MKASQTTAVANNNIKIISSLQLERCRHDERLFCSGQSIILDVELMMLLEYQVVVWHGDGMMATMVVLEVGGGGC